MKDYTWKSVAMRAGLVAFATAAGITGRDGRNREESENFAAFILAKVREDVTENGSQTLAFETKAGKPKTVEATNKAGTYKATGNGQKEQLVYGGEKHGTLLYKCTFLTRALIKQDEFLADLESRGYGIAFSPVAGSETAFLLNGKVKSFKASRAPVAPTPTPDTTEVVATVPASAVTVA